MDKGADRIAQDIKDIVQTRIAIANSFMGAICPPFPHHGANPAPRVSLLIGLKEPHA